MRWVIVGCGYTGVRLANRLTAADVTVTRRTLAAAEAVAAELGAHPAAYTLGAPAPLVTGAIAIVCAPPGADPHRELAALVAARPARLVYLSSTAVYGAGGGAWVDEGWPVAPLTAAGRARAAAESALDDAAITLRIAGIHGPGRSMAERLRAGGYRIIGDGTSHVSRIHVDDLVEAILRAGTSDIRGPVNIADDDPAPIGDVADAVAAQLGLPAPPRVDASLVAPELAGMLTADRRIANTRMKRELGVTLRFPSWRDALATTS